MNSEDERKSVTCETCFRHCHLTEGQTGFCKARGNRGGEIVPLNYGLLTALALDPIEKKPLRRFHPGSFVLSIGSFGCNLHCPFCQNNEISYAGESEVSTKYVSPEELCSLAVSSQNQGNIGVAYTYNEALMAHEYVRDTARLVHEAGLFNVLVTNGCVSRHVLEEILPYIDAMNIDLKSFREDVYRDILKGNLSDVKAFIERSVQSCHVELTTLIVPGMNDSEEEMEGISSYIASLTDVNPEQGQGENIPLHISRFLPRAAYSDREPTPVETVYHLADIARRHLKYVYTGNC